MASLKRRPSRKAQEEFIQLAWKHLLRYSRKFYRDPDDRISAMNLLVARLPEIAKAYDPCRRPPLAFLKGIIRNGYVDQYRRSVREHKIFRRLSDQGQQDDSMPPGFIMDQSLPHDLQTIARKWFLEGADLEEISEETGLSITGVRKEIRRIRWSLLQVI